jgi:hypothetical protein
LRLQRRYESEVRSSCDRFLREDRSWVAALSGVWNWRGTNEAGGKVALPEWESVALNGRKVYVVLRPQVCRSDVRVYAPYLENHAISASRVLESSRG